jgi:hypothetical protein
MSRPTETYVVEFEWLDNKFMAEVVTSDDCGAIILESVTLTDIYQPFKKPEANGLHSPWAAMTPSFTFTADWLPDHVTDQIEFEIEHQQKWDEGDAYKDAYYDR